jgi:Flp pilus assembly protein TadB
MMKQVRFTLLMVFGAFLFLQPAQAAIMTRTETTEVVQKRNDELKKEFKVKKKMNKLQKFIKKLGGLSDSTDKWLWFAIIGWGAAIVLWIVAAATVTVGSLTGFGVLGLIALLCSLFGSVSFIVWLVKKLGS